MRSLIVALGFVLFCAVGAEAQTSIRSQEIGDFTFSRGTVDGVSVSGRSQTVGSFRHSNWDVGNTSVSGSSQEIGSTTSSR
jgi:hypothetical protein